MSTVTRRDFVKFHFATLTAGLAGCGSGGASIGELPEGEGPAPAPLPPAPPLPTQLSLNIRSGSVTGNVPYTATVLPLRGEVPPGYTITSADDATIKASILSTHDDGSAAVVIVAGETNFSAQNSDKQLAIGIAAAGTPDTPLTAERISALVSNITVNFSGTYGSASLSDFGRPELIWWANSRIICARYKIAAPTPGSTALEAVIDITAYGSHNRALIEVVVENGKIDALNSSYNVKPAAATYSAAAVSVNGTTVATVSTAGAYTGTHQPFRAWYCKGWVGGDPGVRATQRHQDLQRHPLFWKMDKDCAADLKIYASDTYMPWGTGRHRATNMGGGGDHDSIGPLTKWDALALQSGDYRAWNASEQNALALLTYNVNYRDSVTGMVPDHNRMPSKAQLGGAQNWPVSESYSSGATALFEQAHHPAGGLMAFIARPSPVYIETAQKIGTWNATANSSPGILALFPAATVGVTDVTGMNYAGQARSFAWGVRSVMHATFLSPAAALNAPYASKLTWRAGGLVWLSRSARYAYSYKLDGLSEHLRIMWDDGPKQKTSDHQAGWAGLQTAPWMNYFVVGEMHKFANVRLLTGADKTYIDDFADWLLEQPVRWVNDQADGAWRYLRYSITYKRADGTAPTSYADQMDYDISGSGPSSTKGGWGGLSASDKTTWSEIQSFAADTTAGANFPSQFWYALVAAVERGVPGAQAAWQTVTGLSPAGRQGSPGITNLNTWRDGFATEPRWGAYPRSH